MSNIRLFFSNLLSENLTDKLDKKSPPKICPTPTSGSFVLPPNYNPPSSHTKYTDHIAVYYTKEPEKFYYPIESKE